MLVLCVLASSALAGPYSAGLDDPTNVYDAPVPGFVGPDGDGVTPYVGGSNYLNPEFLGWATGHVNYVPASYIVENGPIDWKVPERAHGPATGKQRHDVVVLGERDQDEIDDHIADPEISPPGEITLTFDTPIRNGVGADLAVFENGFLTGGSTAIVFAELAYVEVSSDGGDNTFVRFPSDSLTSAPVAPGVAIDVTNVFNLAGKHVNSGASDYVPGDCWGTPFDLDDLLDDPKVISGVVDLDAITHVKIVDIPGSGDFYDGDGDPIYDPWWEVDTGGFDLDAVGVLNEWPDFDFDGDVDADDIDLLCAAVRAASTDPVFDLDNDGDLDEDDFVTMVETCVETTVGRGSAVGDFNLDGEINITDLQLMKASFGLTGVGFADGNANCDLVVDVTDLQVLKANFGFVAGAVPEPATLTLLAVAGAAGLARRRR